MASPPRRTAPLVASTEPERASEAYLSTIPASLGARIVHSELEANRLLLHLEGGGSDVLVIVDVRNGREIGRVVLAPSP